ncbi:MAG: hypothetical protein ACI4WR_05550 [Bulleidia sp.]
MAKYSRTQKYEELRSRLQSDAETSVSTRDLSSYEKRLNQIDSSNFHAPEEPASPAADHDPIHARRRQEPVAQPAAKPEEPAAEEPSFLNSNENYTHAFNNEYLNEYIREAKQYNVDQGNAYSQNTDLNILKSLNVNRSSAPSKPYPSEPAQKPFDAETISRAAAASEPVKKQETSDIPFQKKDDSDFEDYLSEDTNPPLSDTRTMTREDIAAEVQNLIRNAQKNKNQQPSSAPSAPGNNDRYDNTRDHLEADRTARQQLLNETTQMRAQLDDYEDNLTEVSDKMKHTNRVLNIVLIVLIIALVVVLGVVIYWVLMSRGIIR